MSQIYSSLGMMSGTSFDGVDISIIETDGKDRILLKKDLYYPYDKQTKLNIKNFKNSLLNKNIASISKSKSFLELSRIITLVHARSAKKIIENYKKKIDIIGFHGVTVLHKPEIKQSLQLGNPELLASLLKTNVVFNFRQKDLDFGGQGAPLIPVYHKCLANKLKNKKPCMFINIGGISNFTFISKNKFYASDIGPGNCLLDQWIYLNTGKHFDENGRISDKGKVDSNFINNFMDRHDYFLKKNISYDTSDFNISELRGMSLENGAATLSYLSGILIANVINQYKNINNIYFGGGGRKNLFIMKTIQNNIIANIAILDEKKINGDFLESQAFAYIAVRSLLKLPITFKQTTGVKKNVSGGEIYKY